MSDFVNFELAQKLKEKGFDWETSNVYERNTIACRYEDYPAPTISQVLKWLRKKGVDIYCTPNWHNKTDKYYVVCIVRDRIYNHGAYIDDNDFRTYEKAALAGIEYVLDNLI